MRRCPAFMKDWQTYQANCPPLESCPDMARSRPRHLSSPLSS